MRTKEEMLVDVLEARRSYAWLMQAEDMLVIRLAMDVMDLLETLAEKDEELRALYGRIEEAEYGMVGGNLVREAILYQCVSDWMRYITTGKERGK